MVYPRSIPYFVAWCIVLALLALALHPALTKSHLEGFTYLTETMSMLAPDFSAAEPLWSAGADYFYLTRPGTIWAMVPFSALAPGDGYQMLMWIATPVFLSALIIVTKTWSGASWLASFAALLFVPIAIEVNFFTNDNVLAAGFSLWGMVFLLRTQHLVFVALAGALLCIAVLCRLDQVMLGPLFAALAVLKAGTLKDAFARCVILGCGFLGVCLAGLLIDPAAVNILDRIASGRSVFDYWGYAKTPLLEQVGRDMSTAKVAFGLGVPTLLLSIIFFIRKPEKNTTDRIPWLDMSQTLVFMILLLVYPIFIYTMTVGLYLDPRGFLTIVPMLTAIVARGLDVLIFSPLVIPGEFKKENHFNRGIIFLTILGPLFVPAVPEFKETESPPPYVFGRIWYGDAWKEWQGYFSKTEETEERLIATLSDAAPSNIVVTWSWTLDRQFQNRLASAGFLPSSVSEPSCLQNSEVWRNREGNEVYHLRMHVPFQPDAVTNTTAFFVDSGFDCLRTFPDEVRYSIGNTRRFPWAAPLLANVQTELGWYQLTDETLSKMETSARSWMAEAEDYSVDIDVAARQRVLEADALLNPIK